MEGNNNRVYEGTIGEEVLEKAIDSIPEADRSHPEPEFDFNKTEIGKFVNDKVAEWDKQMVDGIVDEINNPSAAENSNKVIDIKEAMMAKTSSHNIPVEDSNEENELEKDIPTKAIEDPENPLNDVSMRNMVQLMKQVGEMVKIMEATWVSSKEEFSLTDTHMKQLYQYNEEHRTEMPDYLSAEDKENWDHFNGLDNIPEETVLEIFGEDHPIIGVANSQTIDRIKAVTNEFFTWMTTLKEYRQINDAYLQLVELQEEGEIEKLRLIADGEQDPAKKEVLQKSIEMYYNRKYLDFLAEDLDEKTINQIVDAFSDKNKISYWLKRSQDKLEQLKISTKIILEISQFEKRFLSEKYHKLSNVLLLHFMQTVIYCNCGDKKDVGRNKAVNMVLTLDRIVRNTTTTEVRDRVMNNIMKFLDNFIDKIGVTEVKPEETETPQE